jgi:hypothetical protein
LALALPSASFPLPPKWPLPLAVPPPPPTEMEKLPLATAAGNAVCNSGVPGLAPFACGLVPPPPPDATLIGC